MSLPKVLRGHCFKNFRKDVELYHQRKCDLSFPFSSGLNVLYSGVGNWGTAFQDFVRTWMSKIFRIQNFVQFVNPGSHSDLEEGVDEKQHHESEDGVIFTLHR